MLLAAKDEILAANHYVECCYLTTALQDRRNLYSGSAGGGVLEAGIISFEGKVVEAITKYITDLQQKTESPDITYYNKYYGHR